jgi:hypothetical protein
MEKLVSGQRIRGICAPQEISQLQTDIEFQGRMILACERKLEVALQEH